MTVGDINKITLSFSSFERIISKGQFYVDKTRFIEHFLNSSSEVCLVVRQRRLGKTLNMDTLRCFLTDKEDLRHLFKGLYIEKSPVWEMANSAPVFYFDFKALDVKAFKLQIVQSVNKHIYSAINPKQLDGYCKDRYDSLMGNPYIASLRSQ